MNMVGKCKLRRPPWLLSWEGDAGEQLTGIIEKVDKSFVETLYFDGPKTEDWPAFIKRDGKIFLGLRGEWLLNISQLQL